MLIGQLSIDNIYPIYSVQYSPCYTFAISLKTKKKKKHFLSYLYNSFFPFIFLCEIYFYILTRIFLQNTSAYFCFFLQANLVILFHFLYIVLYIWCFPLIIITLFKPLLYSALIIKYKILITIHHYFWCLLAIPVSLKNFCCLYFFLRTMYS